MAITLGTAGAVNQKTINLDALFSLSMAARQKKLIDAISKNNPFMHRIIGSGAYESQPGGTHIEIPLMHAIGSAEPYSGFDTLDTTPIDGITTATYIWRQLSIPVIISGLEKKQNKQNIIPLLATKIKQAELGIKESFNKHLIRGNLDNGGSIQTPYTNAVTGRQSINSLHDLIQSDPTASDSVGGIPQDSC